MPDPTDNQENPGILEAEMVAQKIQDNRTVTEEDSDVIGPGSTIKFDNVQAWVIVAEATDGRLYYNFCSSRDVMFVFESKLDRYNKMQLVESQPATRIKPIILWAHENNATLSIAGPRANTNIAEYFGIEAKNVFKTGERPIDITFTGGKGWSV